MANRVIHFEIGGSDLDGAANFFEQVFGWTSEPYGQFGRALSADVTAPVTGHLAAIPDVPTPYVMVYVEVEDIPATLARIAEVGGEAVVGPLPMPEGGQFAWFKDPSGNMLGLLQKDS